MIILSAGFVAIVVIAIFILSLMAESIAKRIPFSFEQKLARNLPFEFEDSSPVQKYLQSLGNRLARAQGVSEPLQIHIHYAKEGTVNAFATLGGHIVMYQGLLKKLPSENALSMVLSHEIAHIKYRHPIMSMGKAIIIGLGLAAVSGSVGNDLAIRMLGNAGSLTALSFSREHEREADQAGLAAVAQLYGHVSGADDLFKVFLSLEKDNLINLPQFFNTHPDTISRIEKINEVAVENGWPVDKEITPLPQFYIDEMKSDDD